MTQESRVSGVRRCFSFLMLHFFSSDSRSSPMSGGESRRKSGLNALGVFNNGEAKDEKTDKGDKPVSVYIHIYKYILCGDLSYILILHRT